MYITGDFFGLLTKRKRVVVALYVCTRIKKNVRKRFRREIYVVDWFLFCFYDPVTFFVRNRPYESQPIRPLRTYYYVLQRRIKYARSLVQGEMCVYIMCIFFFLMIKVQFFNVARVKNSFRILSAALYYTSVNGALLGKTNKNVYIDTINVPEIVNWDIKHIFIRRFRNVFDPNYR